MNFRTIMTFVICIFAVFLWTVETPQALTHEAWHLFIIFVATVGMLIFSTIPMGVVAITALVIAMLTSTLTTKVALSGFSEGVIWLVVCAFIMARAVIKTGLGTRIAYLLISMFGKTNLGVSYSLLMTEAVIAPMIPSAVSRGGGIIYPIAKAVIENYESQEKDEVWIAKIRKYFLMMCLHSNIITSAMFLTAMAGNLVAQNLAISCGVEITWANWAVAGVVPGIITLCFLPFIVAIFYPLPKHLDNNMIIAHAKDGLKKIGKMGMHEIVTACTFLLLLAMWTLEKQIGITATTTAMLGMAILLITKVLEWEDVTTSKAAWDTFIWFAILVTLANSLSTMGVTVWIGKLIEEALNGYDSTYCIAIIAISLFFAHYLFASVTVYFSAMYVVFLMAFIGYGITPLVAAFSLIFIIMLSSGFTHYGIASAPVFFSTGYMTVKEWWKSSGFITIITAIIWFVSCIAWWKIIGWI